MIRLTLVLLLISTNAFAWGRRGHSIVCQTAAALLGERAPFMKKHSFDLGYYCNVPDLIWKKPATYAVEAPQHFMDLEIFARAGVTDFSMSRADFEKAYPAVPVSAGRSYWRIREMMESLDDVSHALRSEALSNEARFNAQETWLVTAGAIGHYVGDLSQPLHVTEDYDGQMSDQKGVHAWFEDAVVDELSSGDHPGQLEAAVGALARLKFKAFEKKSAKLSTLEVIQAEAKESNAARAELMKIDKRVGRKDIRKAAHAFEPMIKDRLAAGALALADLWSRELDWKYQGDKFYNFAGAPDYIRPAAGAPPTATAIPTR